jgi:NAD(P)-dependent dehydrogenase (short-subunit alcohol dehydrogenase family)
VAVGELAGKVAVVTGGSSGLGREIALEYAARGAAVVVASNAPTANEAVAAEAGGSTLAMSVDVRIESEVRDLFAQTLRELGAVDVLVAAAGLDVRESPAPDDRHVRHVRLDTWETVIGVNLTGTFLCIREALPYMIDRSSGSIVTLTSGTVRVPRPGLAAYTSSKAAIVSLTRIVALEVASLGIRANVIEPGGPTRTAFFGDSVPPEVQARMHDPAIIRGCAAYLATDESAGVTGESLVATEWNRERGLRLCSCAECAG